MIKIINKHYCYYYTRHQKAKAFFLRLRIGKECQSLQHLCNTSLEFHLGAEMRKINENLQNWKRSECVCVHAWSQRVKAVAFLESFPHYFQTGFLMESGVHLLARLYGQQVPEICLPSIPSVVVTDFAKYKWKGFKFRLCVQKALTQGANSPAQVKLLVIVSDILLNKKVLRSPLEKNPNEFRNVTRYKVNIQNLIVKSVMVAYICNSHTQKAQAGEI